MASMLKNRQKSQVIVVTLYISDFSRHLEGLGMYICTSSVSFDYTIYTQKLLPVRWPPKKPRRQVTRRPVNSGWTPKLHGVEQRPVAMGPWAMVVWDKRCLIQPTKIKFTKENWDFTNKNTFFLLPKWTKQVICTSDLPTLPVETDPCDRLRRLRNHCVGSFQSPWQFWGLLGGASHGS